MLKIPDSNSFGVTESFVPRPNPRGESGDDWDESAENFYRRMSMIDCGLDAQKDNLTYFEWYQRQTPEGEDWQNEVDWDTTVEEGMKPSGGDNDL